MPSTRAPPTNTSRRAVLAGAVGVVASFAGCLGGDGDSPDGSPTSTDATSTTLPPCSDDLDRPRDEHGPDYPSLPTGDSGAVAMDFALGFEESLQRNRIRLLEGPLTYLAVVDTAVTEPRSVDGGQLLGVRLSLEYGYEDHTSTAESTPESFHAETSAAASYLVSTTRALRVGTDELTHVDPRESADGSVVACEEE